MHSKIVPGIASASGSASIRRKWEGPPAGCVPPCRRARPHVLLESPDIASDPILVVHESMLLFVSRKNVAWRCRLCSRFVGPKVHIIYTCEPIVVRCRRIQSTLVEDVVPTVAFDERNRGWKKEMTPGSPIVWSVDKCGPLWPASGPILLGHPVQRWSLALGPYLTCISAEE